MIQYDEIRQRILTKKSELDDLRVALKLDDSELEASKLEEETTADGFWNDPATAQRILQNIKRLRNKTDEYNDLKQSYQDLLTLCEIGVEENDESLLTELTQEYDRFVELLNQSRLAVLLSGEYDACNAIVTLHAGAGGTEAQDWVQMLYRMYAHWAENRGFTLKLADWLDGDEAGLKSVTLMINGSMAYGYMKSETGVHRLIRISPFDAGGRRHTSFAAVEVTPVIEDTGEITIRPEDIRVDTYKSSGAGGQHVNKTESAVRITHLPTGIVVACQQERSQPQNRETAMTMLRSQLAQIKAREHYERIEDIKGVQMKIEWGSQIRTYTFMPYTLVKDHRTNYETGNVQAVMDGGIDGFINAYLIETAD